MDAQNKEQAVRPEPVPPQDVALQPFDSYLKTLMESNNVRGKDLATIARVPPVCASRWADGRLMPTIGQAEALDAFFGSSIVENYRDQLRPDKKPVEKAVNQEKPKKPVTLTPGTIPVGSPEEAEAINNFLLGFGHNRNNSQPASRENMTFLGRGDSVLDILRLVMECLQLILQANILDNNTE